MNNVEFDEQSHTYKVDGRVVPGVTDILTAVGAINDRWFTEETRRRGTIVALATELDARGELDLESVAAECRGYVLAARKFRSELGGSILMIEQPVCHTSGYAGTPDLVVMDYDGTPYVIDYKTGVACAWHALQLAAYEQAIDHVHGAYSKRRLGVYLKADGKYVTKEYDDDNDRHVWCAAVVSYNWMKGRR